MFPALIFSNSLTMSDYKCESGIEKSVQRITDWHHEAFRVMTNTERKGQIALSHPYTRNGFFPTPLNLNFIFQNWYAIYSIMTSL